MEDYTFDQRDEFNRKQIATNVSALLSSDVDVSPMVVDGLWGTGKSEFCFKLINLMKESDTHHLVYVDAFQADHADEPLLTVLAEVVKILPDDAAKRSFIKKALPAARYGLKTLGKAAFGHILKQEISEVAEGYEAEIKKVADKTIDASVEALIKDHVEASKNLENLQKALKKIAQEKPIILFIDELDRCRPDFAVHLLEVIKHTFDVDGVQFVLITNTQQLKASINHCYGDSVQAQSYLDKFIKFSFSLNKSTFFSQSREIDTSKKHFDLLVAQNQSLQNTFLNDNDSAALGLVHRCIECNGLSLRDVERLVRYLKVYQQLTNNDLNKPSSGMPRNEYHTFYLIRLYAVCLSSILPVVANDITNGYPDAVSLTSLISIDTSTLFEEINLIKTYDMVAILLAQECKINATDYFPSENMEEKFSQQKRYYFDFQPDEGDLIKELRGTLKTLSLTA
ncbi:KAP family NTPase [Photobacterium rosenbergii]|nr:KAP family NTPase [Photobacterium rosenbergii]